MAAEWAAIFLSIFKYLLFSLKFFRFFRFLAFYLNLILKLRFEIERDLTRKIEKNEDCNL